eukprot:UN05454
MGFSKINNQDLHLIAYYCGQKIDETLKNNKIDPKKCLEEISSHVPGFKNDVMYNYSVDWIEDEQYSTLDVFLALITNCARTNEGHMATPSPLRWTLIHINHSYTFCELCFIRMGFSDSLIQNTVRIYATAV